MLKIGIYCTLLMTLTACSAPQNQVIFNPVYKNAQVSNINASVSTSVIDLRGDNSTLKIINDKQTKTIASQGVADSVKSILDSALSRNGARVSNRATTRFELDINTLQSVVTEKLMSHTSHANTAFTVRIIRANSNFSKTYSGTANLEGPLSHDRAKIEGQLNKLTEQLITRIVSDPELITFLEGTP